MRSSGFTHAKFETIRRAQFSPESNPDERRKEGVCGWYLAFDMCCRVAKNDNSKSRKWSTVEVGGVICTVTAAFYNSSGYDRF